MRMRLLLRHDTKNAVRYLAQAYRSRIFFWGFAILLPCNLLDGSLFSSALHGHPLQTIVRRRQLVPNGTCQRALRHPAPQTFRIAWSAMTNARCRYPAAYQAFCSFHSRCCRIEVLPSVLGTECSAGGCFLPAAINMEKLARVWRACLSRVSGLLPIDRTHAGRTQSSC